jgi:hypothetical protein
MSKAKAPKSDKREDVLVSARVKVPPAPPRPERGGPPNEEAGLSACTLTDMCWQCARCGAVKLLDGAQPGWKWRSEGPSHWLHRCQTAAELEAAEVEDCTTAPQDQVAKCHDLLGRVVPPGELPQRIAWLMASWRELTRRGASAGAAHVQAKPAESEFVTVKGLLDKEAEARLLADLAKRAAAVERGDEYVVTLYYLEPAPGARGPGDGGRAKAGRGGDGCGSGAPAPAGIGLPGGVPPGERRVG